MSEGLRAAETHEFVETKFDDDMKTMMSPIHNTVQNVYYRTKLGQNKFK